MSQTKKTIFLHNPGGLTEEALISSFVVREKEFQSIFDDLKNSDGKKPERHCIIQGGWGSGKTTLLYRIYYEVKNDKGLSANVIPLLFNEEQYRVRNLCKLWESLCERLEDIGGFKGILNEFEGRLKEDDFEARSFEVIANALKREGKHLVVFLDNVGSLMDKLDNQECTRLHEILLTSPDIRVIGASSATLEHTYNQSKPFFDCFQFVYLNDLNANESARLLLRLGEVFERPGIRRIIDEQPERIETLRRLTGGVIRTMALLFEICSNDEYGNAFQDLETALDRITPHYKQRMDGLSSRQQEVVDAIATSWDATTTREIAKKTRMESKVITTQLKELEKSRIIEKIDQVETKTIST